LAGDALDAAAAANVLHAEGDKVGGRPQLDMEEAAAAAAAGLGALARRGGAGHGKGSRTIL
jgi:hypothetical protein